MRAVIAAAIVMSMPAAALVAQAKPVAGPVKANLAPEVVGHEPKSFLPMVGSWTVTRDAGKKVIFVDGRSWKKGQPAGGLVDKARAIYGREHEDFIESIQAFAYYPIAVFRDVADFHDGDISMKFLMVGGALDRCAGILFNVKPNGDYLTVRFNGTEDNVVLWTFNNGKRTMVKRAPEEHPLELGTWHELRLSVHGTAMTTYLDGVKVLEYTLKEPVSGKVGLWSKTDSMVEFSDFLVALGEK